MVKSYPLLKPLTDQLMDEVRAYGILEVSLEQYQTVCNSIVRFAQSSQMDSYSPELMDSYKDNLDTRYSSGEICREYHRFQLRVMRMLSCFADIKNSAKKRSIKTKIFFVENLIWQV